VASAHLLLETVVAGPKPELVTATPELRAAALEVQVGAAVAYLRLQAVMAAALLPSYAVFLLPQ
jgi:hypothetical protein